MSQGSVLNPILFVIIVNFIDDGIASNISISADNSNQSNDVGKSNIHTHDRNQYGKYNYM